MFGKLMKHEMRNTWQLPLLLAGVSVLLSVVVRLELRFIESLRYDAPSVVRAGIYLFFAIFVIYMIATNVLVFFLMPVRFYRESFSDIGYLMHMLPVKKSAFLGAHVLTGGLWICFYVLVDVLCMFIVTSEFELIEFIFDFVFGSLMREIRSLAMGLETLYVLLLVLMGLTLLLTPFFIVLHMDCAVTLGQMFRKHRVFGAVVMFFVLSWLASLVNGIFPAVFLLSGEFFELYSNPRRLLTYLCVTVLVSLLIRMAEAVVYWFISVQRMKKHLNLE